jgi:N-acetylmuramoyl-L-alanine amidase
MPKTPRSFFTLFAAVLLVLTAGAAAAATAVKAVTVQSGADVTRVVVDLSGPTKYTYQTLANPHRIVLDLHGTRLAAALDQRGGPIQGIRSGIRNGTDLRLVFDLGAAAKPHVTLHGNQLLLDLQGGGRASAAAPAAEATAAATTSTLRAVKAAEGQRDVVIAIDAGHGGNDPGAIGPGRVQEKQVVLAIARELNALLARERGYKPVLTRNSDIFLPLQTRRDLARKAQADLFVSIHADAFTSPQARGASVFAISDRGATSTMAAFLAKSENKADAIGGVSTHGKDENLLRVLTDLSMSASIDASMRVGDHVLSSMGSIARLHSRRVEQAGFMVLKSPDTPSILVETGFISNPEEARKLATSAYQRQMARAIFNGIHRHFSDSPPSGTWLAWAKRNGGGRTVAGTATQYVIGRGDTLSGIAARYGVPLSTLRAHNNLASADQIRIGQTLLIPAGES